MEKCLNSKLNDIIKEKAICLKNLKIVTEDETKIEILIKGNKGQLMGRAKGFNPTQIAQIEQIAEKVVERVVERVVQRVVFSLIKPISDKVDAILECPTIQKEIKKKF